MDNKEKILLYLAKKKDVFTLLELSKQVSIPYTSLHRTVKEMEDLVEINEKGKSKLITIKWNSITRAYLTIASFKEKKEFVKKNKIFKKIEDKAEGIVLIFGSYAKNLQRKKSDIDIIIINKNGERSLRFTDLELLFDIKINPIFLSNKEFLLMLKDKEENVGKQALKDHILLSGFFEFWNLLKNGI
jgi:predicted nucleotidyltransferase